LRPSGLDREVVLNVGRAQFRIPGVIESSVSGTVFFASDSSDHLQLYESVMTVTPVLPRTNPPDFYLAEIEFDGGTGRVKFDYTSAGRRMSETVTVTRAGGKMLVIMDAVGRSRDLRIARLDATSFNIRTIRMTPIRRKIQEKEHKS
jgi:hypothetical protein